jgi:hypothetical protein
MIFALPIGIYFLIQEKSSMKKYQAIFDNFYIQMRDDKSLSSDEKVKYLKKMLEGNEYSVLYASKDGVRGEKKIFSIGWLFVGIGTVYVGLLVYILYYFYFQKPHVVEFQSF